MQRDSKIIIGLVLASTLLLYSGVRFSGVRDGGRGSLSARFGSKPN